MTDKHQEDMSFAESLVDYYDNVLGPGQKGHLRHAMPGFHAIINRARELMGLKPLDQWGEETEPQPPEEETP